LLLKYPEAGQRLHHTSAVELPFLLQDAPYVRILLSWLALTFGREKEKVKKEDRVWTHEFNKRLAPYTSPNPVISISTTIQQDSRGAVYPSSMLLRQGGRKREFGERHWDGAKQRGKRPVSCLSTVNTW
jgi:hypothetical protein